MLPSIFACLFNGAAFSHLSSAALQGSTSVLQPVVQQELPLGWGPTTGAVILRLITGRWLCGGRQHPHTQGTTLGKFLGAPPMAHVSQLCQQISVGGPGLPEHCLPCSPCAPTPPSITQQDQHSTLVGMHVWWYKVVPHHQLLQDQQWPLRIWLFPEITLLSC